MTPPNKRNEIALLRWTRAEKAILRSFRTPTEVQKYLDSLGYNCDDITRSPRQVLRVKKAHCFDGAMFAAAALVELGHPPLVMDLRAVEDDDHVVALYKVRNCWGAIAKSNFPGLRYREPIYRTLRELALSYFENYFNLKRKKSLREYSVPFDLRKVKVPWMFTTEDLSPLGEDLDSVRHTRILTKAQEQQLSPLDPRSFKAGLTGVNLRGVSE